MIGCYYSRHSTLPSAAHYCLWRHVCCACLQQYPPPLPPAAAPRSASGCGGSFSNHAGTASNGGGLEPTGSIPYQSIKVDHVICNSELVLKEVIGSGAEGKVGTKLPTVFGSYRFFSIESLPFDNATMPVCHQSQLHVHWWLAVCKMLFRYALQLPRCLVCRSARHCQCY